MLHVPDSRSTLHPVQRTEPNNYNIPVQQLQGCISTSPSPKTARQQPSKLDCLFSPAAHDTNSHFQIKDMVHWAQEWQLCVTSRNDACVRRPPPVQATPQLRHDQCAVQSSGDCQSIADLHIHTDGSAFAENTITRVSHHPCRQCAASNHSQCICRHEHASAFVVIACSRGSGGADSTAAQPISVASRAYAVGCMKTWRRRVPTSCASDKY